MDRKPKQNKRLFEIISSNNRKNNESLDLSTQHRQQNQQKTIKILQRIQFQLFDQ